MNRIFFIHSNILTICCYQTVKESLERKEKVIIITNRGYTWPFFEGRVMVYDFTAIFKGEDKNREALHSVKAWKDYKRYKNYRTHLNKVIDEIVAKEAFIFYLPSMALDMTASFAHNKYCKGYYYVDEGSLSYVSENDLKRYIPNRFKNAIKSLIGIKDHYHYEMSSKFKGTISITNDAFKWNVNKEKIVNSANGFIEVAKQDIPCFDKVILTEYLKQEFDIIVKSINYSIEKIWQENPNFKIGIKIHPQAITYNKEKTIALQQYISNKYAGKITLIPSNVSIEVMSLVYHPTIYSLFEVSSILLYALLFKSSKTKLIAYNNDSVNILDIKTVEEFNKFLNL